MHKSNEFTYANIVQLLFDEISLVVTYFLAYLIAHGVSHLQTITQYMWILIIFMPLWVSIMALRGMYDNTTFYYFDRILRNVILASAVSGLSIGTMLFFIKSEDSIRLFIATFVTLCVLIMFLERSIFGLVYKRNGKNLHSPRMILVCTGETCIYFYKYLRKTHIRYNVVGIVRVGEEYTRKDVLNLGTLENLEDILKNQIVDEVVMALPRDYVGEVEKYVRICETMGITVHMLLNLYDLKLSRMHISMLGPLPMLTFHTVTLNPVQKALKRFVDITGSLIGIVITFIAAIFIVPAIKLDSKGPVLFKQKRVGRYGRTFNLYKFRTMCVDAEAKQQELLQLNEHQDGMMFKLKDDPRITRVGAFLRKTSLDELPQFFQVLKGDMSLVGTRPPTLDEVAQYHIEHLRRISIKPGLTGMWQVSGRSDIRDFEEVVALDTQYIDNWSIWLDFNILLRTVWQVIHRKAAY
ncbi:MAG: sugar transferase [Peptococcaceae bacterium]|nr:sugar transferase [Peptococcaceae bacterium]